MARSYRAKPAAAETSLFETALDALDADELRMLICDMIRWLDDATHARFVNTVVDKAARNASGWVPKGPTDEVVDKIVVFSESAKRVGYADSSDADAYLREGSNAFLGKNYEAAFRIFRALLIPIGHGEIDLGQHELIDEVLGVDPATCASQYVVSMYMTATAKTRGKAVLSAVDAMRHVGHFWEPLRDLELVAVEPLPGFDDFLKQWRALLEQCVAKERQNEWDSDEDRWLREVVQRIQGPDGLGEIARASRRADDLRAWCRALVAAGDWKAALTAYDDAAEIVVGKANVRGDFLDGAALAAQELGREDLPKRLERAWHAAPSMMRLRRWLGSSETKTVLRKHVHEAQRACPKNAARQRALLCLLDANFTDTAELLAEAPGLGWSDPDHPGHLLFPLFSRLLGDVELSEQPAQDFDNSSLFAKRDESQLATPGVGVLLDLSGVLSPRDTQTRAVVIKAMRTAAEKRVAGVTANKRRRQYQHAASLALACAEVDGSPEGAQWLAAIRDTYRRYPALQRALCQR